MKLGNLTCITGGVHKDNRGILRYANDFDMTAIRRMYHIVHDDLSVIRAWQGHEKESKWFYCTAGEWMFNFIKISNWMEPAKQVEKEKMILSSVESKVIFVPGGYATGFRALSESSSLVVYSDVSVEESNNDDFRFDLEYWKFENE